MAKSKKFFIDDEEIDLFPGDLKVGIDMKISSIKDLSFRGNSKTTTIDIPATAGNKQKLGFPEDWNAAQPIDQTTKPIGRLEVEGTNVMRGFAKAEAAITEGRLSHYQLKALGDNGDWRERMKDRKVSDLDYSSDNHTLNAATIVASWTVDSALRNYVYDLIDRGKFTGKNSASGIDGSGVNVEDCYPAISKLSILEKSFKAIGYTISSDFLYGSFFSKLYFPFINNVFKHSDDWAALRIFKAVQDAATGSFIDYFKAAGDQSQQYPLKFDNDSTNDGVDALDLWKLRSDNLTYLLPYGFSPSANSYKSYKAVASCRHKFRYRLSYSMSGTTTPGGTVYFSIYKKGFGSMSKVLVDQFSIPWSISSSDIDVTTNYLDLEYGDTVWLEMDISFSAVTTGAAVLRIYDHNPAGNKYSYFQLVGLEGPVPVHAQSEVDMNSNLPDIGQLEFIQGLKDHFNLYFKPDVEARVIYIEPRDEFYAGTAIDWSHKLDRNKPITIEYLGDNYTKRLRYKFKEDPGDKFVEEWNKQNEDSFGSHEATFANVFSKDERTDYENKLFAATWMDVSPAPLVGLKTVKIPRMWTDVQQPAKSTAFAPRVLYYAGLTALASSTDGWVLSMLDKTVSNTVVTPVALLYAQTSYPRFYFQGEAAGEENLGYDNTDTSHGSWAKHYANTHKIIDDGRLITASLYLNDADISKFDFRVPVYIELEGNGAYFEVESIEGYDPDSKESTTVKLIKQVAKTALVTVSPIAATAKKKRFPLSTTPMMATSRMHNGNPRTSFLVGGIEVIRIDSGVVKVGGTPVVADINGIVVPVLYTDANNNLSQVIKE